MSLRSALEHLPHDRESDALLKEVLNLVRRHEGEWVEPRRIAIILGSHEDRIRRMLGTLAEFFVLDFVDGPPRYRYKNDRLLEIEIDRFTRRADTHHGTLQNNVEKFRQRYGSR